MPRKKIDPTEGALYAAAESYVRQADHDAAAGLKKEFRATGDAKAGLRSAARAFVVNEDAEG